MAIYLAKISFQLDSALPRDAITINPHYRYDDAQGLADALKTKLLANAQVTPSQPFTIKIYDATKAPPSYPLATSSNLTGFIVSALPREVSVCLSYYSARNIPRQRGRLYIPAKFVGGSLGIRPSAPQMTTVLDWGAMLFKSLPSGCIPVVWSRLMKADYAITNYWCDDEWDTVRSRGMKATTRQTATLP